MENQIFETSHIVGGLSFGNPGGSAIIEHAVCETLLCPALLAALFGQRNVRIHLEISP